MNLALILNNEIVEIADSSKLFPNVSFPANGVSQEFLTQNSAMEVIVWEMFNSELEKLETVAPYIKDGKVYTCLKVNKSEIEIQTYYDSIRLAEETKVRTQRNQLLKDSDWTQVADAPVDKEAWATYRQALRDIPSQVGFPTNVIFPTPPL
jgi:hypothetical protein